MIQVIDQLFYNIKKTITTTDYLITMLYWYFEFGFLLRHRLISDMFHCIFTTVNEACSKIWHTHFTLFMLNAILPIGYEYFYGVHCYRNGNVNCSILNNTYTQASDFVTLQIIDISEWSFCLNMKIFMEYHLIIKSKQLFIADNFFFLSTTFAF